MPGPPVPPLVGIDPAAHAHCGSLVPCPADPGGQHPVPPPGCPAAS